MSQVNVTVELYVPYSSLDAERLDYILDQLSELSPAISRGADDTLTAFTLTFEHAEHRSTADLITLATWRVTSATHSNFPWASTTAMSTAEYDRRSELSAAEITAEKLVEEHGGYWAEHPVHPSTDWRDEVAAESTRQSYWEWVAGKFDADEESK
jgi:hypothetical protein